MRKQMYPEAMRDIDYAVSLRPSDAYILDSKAEILLEWGKFKKERPDEYSDEDWRKTIQESLKVIERALELTPSPDLRKHLEAMRDECNDLLGGGGGTPA